MDEGAAAIAKERAEALFSKGRYVEALAAYGKIEGHGQKDPRIYLRMGDISRKLDDPGMAVDFYAKAADSFMRLGFSVKAMAVLKMALVIGPDRGDIKERLSALHAGSAGTKKDCPPGHGKKARLPRMPLFSDFNEKEFLEAVRMVRARELGRGEVLFGENDPGDSIYIVTEGELEASVRVPDSPPVSLAVFREGDVFGEFGFFLHSRRTAEVSARARSSLLEFTKDDLNSLIRMHGGVEEVLLEFYKERVVDKLMALSEIFRPMSAKDRKEVLSRTGLLKAGKGSVIVKEGEKGDTMYLIKEGMASVEVEGKAGRTMVTGLEEGDFFGEIALATGRPRFATVTALSDMELMVFSRPMIKDVLARYPAVKGPLEKVIKERVADVIKAREGKGAFL